MLASGTHLLPTYISMNAKSNVSPVPVLKNDAESIRELITTANYILLAIMTRQGPLTMP